MEGITLLGLLSKVTTTSDGGWAITFAVGQDEAQAVLQLAQFRDQLIQLACIPVDEA